MKVLMKAVADMAMGFIYLICGIVLLLVKLINRPNLEANSSIYFGLAVAAIGATIVLLAGRRLAKVAEQL